jgi:hypothetical protein
LNPSPETQLMPDIIEVLHHLFLYIRMRWTGHEIQNENEKLSVDFRKTTLRNK